MTQWPALCISSRWPRSVPRRNSSLGRQRSPKALAITNANWRRSLPRNNRLQLTGCPWIGEFAEQRSRRTCAIWTRRDRQAAPAATATRLRPDARTWIRYVRSSTTVASICEWAPSRSASARWSIPGWNSASTSSWNRTPSVTTSCWPSRQPREWPSSSSKCTSYSWTMRWVGAECEWHLHEPFSRLATFLLMTNS